MCCVKKFSWILNQHSLTSQLVDLCEGGILIPPAASLDYTATTTQLTFVPNDERLCVEIAIIDDQLVEETEELQVRLISSSSITIFLDSTTVSILDNDSKLVRLHMSCPAIRLLSAGEDRNDILFSTYVQG